MKLPEGLLLDLNSGLKATTMTEILNVNGRGSLLAIMVDDLDGATQNETIKLEIDGNVLLSTSMDFPNAKSFIELLHSITRQSLVVTTTSGVIIAMRNTGLKFHTNLTVSYLRAAAGTTGLTINILYTKTP